MSTFPILLCIIFLLMLILTERIYIVIKQEERFSLEFHFVFIAFCFKKRKDEGENSLPYDFYRKLFERLKPLIKRSEIVVDYITPAAPTGEASVQKILRPLEFYFLAAALSSIASAYTRGVTIQEGCMQSFFDKSNNTKFKITLRVRLYYVVYSLILILFKLISTKTKSKRIKNV